MISEIEDKISDLCSACKTKMTSCFKDRALSAEEKATQQDASRLIAHLTKGEGKGEAYRRLGEFVDTFGSRIAGSQRLEASIDHLAEAMRNSGLQVRTEQFAIDGWRRGEEEAQLLQPISKRLPVLGLGTTVPTPAAGVTAQCLVVQSFDELDRRSAEVPGRIVVFNQPYVNYAVSVQYRVQGASRASAHGAVAALIRSVTPFSIGSPHTGAQQYAPNLRKIPAACITVEDAEMLHRMEQRGQNPTVHLRMTSSPCANFTSRNIVADLVGSELPHEAVVIGGHVDSWDVGQGAMDDGGGVFTAWQAVIAMQSLGIRPKRTVRLLVFSGEEFGIWGGQDFYRRHAATMGPHLTCLIESDSGTFTPTGVSFRGSDAAFQQFQKQTKQLDPIGPVSAIRGAGGPDTDIWARSGVPVAELITARPGQSPEFYFNFHHSEGDMLTVQDAGEMDKCAAVFAVLALGLANATGLLPR